MATRKRKKAVASLPPMKLNSCDFYEPVQIGELTFDRYDARKMPDLTVIYTDGVGVTITDASGATVHVPRKNIGSFGMDLGSITSMGYIPPA